MCLILTGCGSPPCPPWSRFQLSFPAGGGVRAEGLQSLLSALYILI